jgi:hypothetical protein
MTRAATFALLLIVSMWSHAKPEVYVESVDQLYAAVNDPGNEGAIVVLAPGTYALVPGDINGGRLELQRDMELQGTPGTRRMSSSTRAACRLRLSAPVHRLPAAPSARDGEAMRSSG